MRRRLKAAAERLLLRAGPAAVSRLLYRGRRLVLAYHNIVPEGEDVRGDASLHLPRDRFAEQLDMLCEDGVEVVALDQLLRSPRACDSGRRVAITFDDAYRGAVREGVDELARRGLPATIFVVPGLLNGQTFWWDALAATDFGLSRKKRDEALRATAGRNAEVIAWARQHGLRVGGVPEHARSASENELRLAAVHEGIELASHTWSHANLARLDEEGCLRELSRAADWLREHHDTGSRWLSYPYGLFGPVATRVAGVLGYEAAFRINGGWLPASPSDQDAYQLPRLNVPAGISRDGFALRLAGFLCD